MGCERRWSHSGGREGKGIVMADQRGNRASGARSRIAPALAVGNAVVAKLSGLNDREAHVRTIGQYKIEGRMTNIGRAERYLAHEDEEATDIVILLCYPLDGWGDGVDMRPLFRREARALKLLGELGRAPVCLVSFEDDNYRLFVTPIRWFKRSRNLRFSVQNSDPMRVDGRVDVELAIDVVTDSFRALADIH